METWIFQANPDQFQVNSYLVSGREIRWTVRQKHLASAMAPGDLVYIWRATGKRKGHGPAGIIASGTLLRGPLEEPDDQAALERWAEAPIAPELRVRVQIERVASPEEVIQRDWLLVDPVLKDLRILQFAAGTNFQLTQRQSVRIAGLWRNHSRPWLPRELLAVLWIKVSAAASHAQADMDSRIEAVAIQIDRTVDAVKNKLQEWGTIDGLLSNGEGPESTQPELLLRERYRNAASGELDADRIQSDYFTMWRERSRSGLGNEADTPPERATVPEEGQGYESDPRVRRAVETRAMQLAIESYRALGFIVCARPTCWLPASRAVCSGRACTMDRSSRRCRT